MTVADKNDIQHVTSSDVTERKDANKETLTKVMTSNVEDLITPLMGTTTDNIPRKAVISLFRKVATKI
jgi:hypothetical protein